jgi:hypothetical protein
MSESIKLEKSKTLKKGLLVVIFMDSSRYRCRSLAHTSALPAVSAASVAV